MHFGRKSSFSEAGCKVVCIHRYIHCKSPPLRSLYKAVCSPEFFRERYNQWSFTVARIHTNKNHMTQCLCGNWIKRSVLAQQKHLSWRRETKKNCKKKKVENGPSAFRLCALTSNCKHRHTDTAGSGYAVTAAHQENIYFVEVSSITEEKPHKRLPGRKLGQRLAGAKRIYGSIIRSMSSWEGWGGGLSLCQAS